MYMLDSLKKEVLPTIKEVKKGAKFSSTSNIKIKSKLETKLNVMNESDIKHRRKRNIDRRSKV